MRKDSSDNPYKLYLSKREDTPEGSIVGDFRKKDDPDFRCEIILDSDQVFRAGEVDSTTVRYPEKYVIYLSAGMLYALQKGGNISRHELYHELGHIHLGHYDSGLVFDGEHTTEDAARIQKEEDDADRFAAEIIGYENSLAALREMLRIRAQTDKRANRNGTEQSVLAIREIRRRIKALEQAAEESDS